MTILPLEKGRFFAGALLLFSVSCAGGGAVSSFREGELVKEKWEEQVALKPLGPEENIKAIPLFAGEHSTHFLVQVREGEKPHFHRDHDLTVFMKEGKGVLHMGGKILSMEKGDIVFIPRGVPHHFTNKHSSPSVAYALYSPSLQGRDYVPLEKDDGKK